MKLLRSILTAGLALAVFSAPARAVTFQVVADTAGSPVTNKIAKAAGTATTLPVSAKSTAFISFDVGNSGINPGAVTAARLVIFFPKVTKAGSLLLFANGSGFTEVFATPTIPTPTAGATIGSPIAVLVADSKNFFTIDVTSQVKSWLTTPATDFGFGISADSPTSTVNVTIGSKEGSGSGYPAVLEVDVNDQSGGAVAGSSATFSGTVAIGTGAGSLGTPLDTALSAAGVTTGNGSPNSSLSLELTNTSTSGNGTSPNVVGIGFGRGSLTTQAIVGGTFGADFLEFFVGSGSTAPKMTIDNDVKIARDAIIGRNVIVNTGKVGIGTTTPAVALDVAGDIQSNGKSVPEAEEKLRIVRGSVLGDGTIKTGTGFTITHTASSGVYTVNFATAFTGVGPTVTASVLQPGGSLTAVIPTINTTSCNVDTFNGATATDLVFSFIAIGTR